MLSSVIKTVVHELAAWVQRLPPRQPRMEALAAALVENFGDHAEPVTSAGLASIEAVGHRFCRHLQLELHPAGDLVVDRTAPGWPPEDATEIRRLGAPISSVRRTDDGLAVVAVDSMPSFAVSRSFVEAAIALADGARGVALDLRRNGGGDPETVATVVGWLCGPDLDLSSVVYRDRVRHWTTPDGPNIPADVPVVILVSDRTYSSGEALAYHLQARGRGPLIGQRTPGAADHVTPVNVTPEVRAILPEAYAVDTVTGSNWEGTGVRPDVEAGPDDTEEVALAALRRSSSIEGAL